MSTIENLKVLLFIVANIFKIDGDLQWMEII